MAIPFRKDKYGILGFGKGFDPNKFMDKILKQSKPPWQMTRKEKLRIAKRCK